MTLSPTRYEYGMMKWTPDKDAIIKEHWPTKSAPQIAAILTNIYHEPFTSAMVSNRRSHISDQIPFKEHIWTKEEEKFVKENYKHTAQSVAYISEVLNIPTSKIRSKIQNLGLARSWEERGHKRWTEEDKDKFRRLIEEREYTVEEAARAMGRPEQASRLKAKQMGIKLLSHYSYYTGTEAAELLGVSGQKITRLIDMGLLKARYLYPRSPLRGWRIEEDDLIEFLRRFPREVGPAADISRIVFLLTKRENPLLISRNPNLKVLAVKKEGNHWRSVEDYVYNNFQSTYKDIAEIKKTARKYGFNAISFVIYTPQPRNLIMVLNQSKNPMPRNIKIALEMRDRYLDDLAAGHNDAAEYWRAQAGAYFTAK